MPATVPIHSPRELGLFLREQRQSLGLSQAALASHIHVGRRWIVEIEAGKASAEIGLVFRLLRFLGCDVRLALPQALTTPEPTTTAMSVLRSPTTPAAPSYQPRPLSQQNAPEPVANSGARKLAALLEAVRKPML